MERILELEKRSFTWTRLCRRRGKRRRRRRRSRRRRRRRRTRALG
jgi:hypothetical protein